MGWIGPVDHPISQHSTVLDEGRVRGIGLITTQFRQFIEGGKQTPRAREVIIIHSFVLEKLKSRCIPVREVSPNEILSCVELTEFTNPSDSHTCDIDPNADSTNLIQLRPLGILISLIYSYIFKNIQHNTWHIDLSLGNICSSGETCPW